MNTIPAILPLVHIGVDVAKAELVADLAGSIVRYPNQPKGIKALLRAASKCAANVRLVCEATAGNKKGKRFIQGGRARVRSTLHMAAVSAARFNKILAPVYRKLREAGKPFKVAITAITRKLLVHLNSLMADFLKNQVAA